MAEHAEKSFENFLKLSPKLRTKMIHKMQPNDRCRFTRCSKLCNKEAKASKNFIHAMHVNYAATGVVVTLKFDDVNIHECSHFYLQHSAKVYHCQMTDHRILWIVDFNYSIDLYKYVKEDIRRMFQSYQSSLKQLTVCDSSLKNLELDIELLKNLEEMNLHGDNDIQKLLSQLQKPLKKLWINGGKDHTPLVDYPQIYQVEEELNWQNAHFNIQQFLQISASIIKVSVGQLTEKDIFKFIRSWQNGTIRKEPAYCQWDCKDSNFNKEKLARLLRLREFHLNQENADIELEFEIKHFKVPGKSACLSFWDEYLSFDTVIREEDDE